MYNNDPINIAADEVLAIATRAEAQVEQLNAATIVIACKNRKNSKVVRDMTKETLAAVFGRELLVPYIKPFGAKEDRLKVQTRCEKTIQHYENYPHEISQTYVEGVYRSGEVTRQSGVKELDEYFKKEYDIFFQNDSAPWLLLMPETYIFLEWPDGEAPLTMADQKEMKMWPRPNVEFADTVKNVSFDRDGCLNWVSRDFGEYVEVLDKTYRYKVAQDGSKVHTVEEHGFKGVPCIRAAWKENAAYRRQIGHAFLHDVIQKALAVLQFLSMLIEAGYYHLHLQLVMSQRTFEKTGGKMGNANVVIEDDEPNGPVTRYLEKPDLEMNVLVDLVFNIYPKSIYRSARLRDRTADKSASGTAKLMDSAPEYAALALVANYFQSIDKKVCDLIATAYTGNPADVEVKYPRAFDLRSAQEILGDLKSLVDLQTASEDVPQSDMLMMKMFEGVIRAWLPDADDKFVKAVLAEMQDSLDEEDLEELAGVLIPPIEGKGSPAPADGSKESGDEGGIAPGSNGAPSGGVSPGSGKGRKTKGAAAPKSAKAPVMSAQ